MSSFAINLKQMPRISHLSALELISTDGSTMAKIENRPGQTGSLAVYNHLGQIFGAITVDAAKKGLELFAEHTDDARANPGKHPDIDRLLAMVSGNTEMLRVRHQFAIAHDDTLGATATDESATSTAKLD
jgi:hypothetical protein